jgi:hypothetical protein
MKLFLKKSFQVFFIICALLSLILQVEAHSGRTDSNGGHHDRSDGSYHYHHGYSAHQHKNGVCPYEFDDKTDYGANSGNIDRDEKSSINTIDLEDDENSITFGDVLEAMLTGLLPAVGFGFLGSYFLSYIWLFIFGEDKGCLITVISFAVISIGLYILLIYNKVM